MLKTLNKSPWPWRFMNLRKLADIPLFSFLSQTDLRAFLHRVHLNHFFLVIVAFSMLMRAITLGWSLWTARNKNLGKIINTLLSIPTAIFICAGVSSILKTGHTYVWAPYFLGGALALNAVNHLFVALFFFNSINKETSLEMQNACFYLGLHRLLEGMTCVALASSIYVVMVIHASPFVIAVACLSAVMLSTVSLVYNCYHLNQVRSDHDVDEKGQQPDDLSVIVSNGFGQVIHSYFASQNLMTHLRHQHTHAEQVAVIGNAAREHAQTIQAQVEASKPTWWLFDETPKRQAKIAYLSALEMQAQAYQAAQQTTDEVTAWAAFCLATRHEIAQRQMSVVCFSFWKAMGTTEEIVEAAEWLTSASTMH